MRASLVCILGDSPWDWPSSFDYLDSATCVSRYRAKALAVALLKPSKVRGIAAVIPPKRNRNVQPVIDGHPYALRNLVERCFSKLKHSRRLATRCDKTADSYIGFILVASIVPLR